MGVSIWIAFKGFVGRIEDIPVENWEDDLKVLASGSHLLELVLPHHDSDLANRVSASSHLNLVLLLGLIRLDNSLLTRMVIEQLLPIAKVQLL